jgi:hypothetical protein
MKKTRKKTRNLLTDIQAGIKDMGLPVESPIEGKRHVTVHSRAFIGSDIMSIQVTFFKRHRILGIQVTSWHSAGEDKFGRLMSFLNYINSMFMDIGSFCLQPGTGKITFRAGYSVIKERIDKDQLTQTLCRVISHGFRGFYLITRAVFEDTPFEEVISDELKRMGSSETAPPLAYIKDSVN